MRAALGIALALLVAGCPKSEEGKGTAAGAEGGAASARDAGGGLAADADSGKGAATAGPVTAVGTYSVSPRAMYIPESKDYASVKQAKDDPTKHVGDGTMTLTLAGERVTGTIDTGPAGPAILDGTVYGDEIRGAVRRKDPTDDGLTGTFLGTRGGDTVTGTLSLAEGSAAIVREGKFTLKTK